MTLRPAFLRQFSSSQHASPRVFATAPMASAHDGSSESSGASGGAVGSSVQFCPTCGNTLLVEYHTSYRFWCASCPYVSILTSAMARSVAIKRKAVEDVLGGADAWKNVDKTEALCPKCGNKEAFFLQIQTRSADEPMTIFFKCTNFQCQAQWKEG